LYAPVLAKVSVGFELLWWNLPDPNRVVSVGGLPLVVRDLLDLTVVSVHRDTPQLSEVTKGSPVALVL